MNDRDLGATTSGVFHAMVPSTKKFKRELGYR